MLCPKLLHSYFDVWVLFRIVTRIEGKIIQANGDIWSNGAILMPNYTGIVPACDGLLHSEAVCSFSVIPVHRVFRTVY